MRAEILGHVADGFEAVRDVFAASFEAGEELGAGFCAILDGDVLVNLYGGWADRKQSQAWTERTLVPVYSTTKGIAALVLASLISELEEGYETPVAQIWPDFAANGKGSITLGEVLSHQAGLPGFVEPIDPALWLDPPACAAAIADLSPMWTPGTAHGYHPLTWGYIAGEIAMRLAGKTLGTVLREDFTQNGTIDFHIGLPASEHARCAELQRPRQFPELGELNAATRAAFLEKWSAPDRGGAIWREIEIPSANGHGTAEAVARLYALYHHAPDVLTRARTAGQDLVLPMETAFGAGIMRNTHGLFGPNPETLGHSGWGGSMAVADPARRLSCAYVMNKQSNVLVGDPRAVRLVQAVYEGL